jgi:hypothetical protein
LSTLLNAVGLYGWDDVAQSMANQIDVHKRLDLMSVLDILSSLQFTLSAAEVMALQRSEGWCHDFTVDIADELPAGLSSTTMAEGQMNLPRSRRLA